MVHAAQFIDTCSARLACVSVQFLNRPTASPRHCVLGWHMVVVGSFCVAIMPRIVSRSATMSE